MRFNPGQSGFLALISVAVAAFTAQPTFASFMALFIVNPVLLVAIIVVARREGRWTE